MGESVRDITIEPYCSGCDNAMNPVYMSKLERDFIEGFLKTVNGNVCCKHCGKVISLEMK